jgi:lactocepin
MKRNSTLLAVIVCSAIFAAGNAFAAGSGGSASGSSGSGSTGSVGSTTGGSMGNTTTDTTGAGTGNVAQPNNGLSQPGQAGTMGTNPSTGTDPNMNSGNYPSTGTNTTPHNTTDDSTSGK